MPLLFTAAKSVTYINELSSCVTLVSSWGLRTTVEPELHNFMREWLNFGDNDLVILIFNIYILLSKTYYKICGRQGEACRCFFRNVYKDGTNRILNQKFCLLLNVGVSSYDHCETVSSSNHTFSLASLNKRLTSIYSENIVETVFYWF